MGLSQIIAEVQGDPVTWAWVLGSTALYLIMCAVIWAGEQKKARLKREAAAGATPWLVVYASQTGQAEEIATATLKRLVDGGQSARIVDMADLKLSDLESAQHVLCVASTTGDGDAPDSVLGFEAKVMSDGAVLSHLDYAVLALGDKSYADFCAFGRRLHDWLRASGAKPYFEVIEVDDLDPAALNRWYENLSDLGAKSEAFDPKAAYGAWQLKARECLNPDSDASKLYRVVLEPQSGILPDWQAGDLAEIMTVDGHVRDYSLASLPTQGVVELYVREVIKDDGSRGLGSGLLTHDLGVDQTVLLRTKSHKNFHTPEGDGPLLLIAAGSGLAGLNAHIDARVLSGRKANWVVYGERHPIRDGALCKALTARVQAGELSDLTLCFSRPDSGKRIYVQDAIAAAPDRIRAYLADNGAVMVCGGLSMGQGVDKALRTIMGDAWVIQALADGRYRRDLY
ncbi:NADPH cytochrome P450 oxidoreductase family protein [Asticcacaulis machinosus]|uniref:NADPH--hemoprotein reductase n=1 Tax=Asticcacaulis machinosus TaxID=2984211 RepID=A0ABT5HJN9_9CAUL|nr:NADPH cytochrome P450 oxidoreductase family protein [Asticcacaulis machinosus]MDC7676407.1 NADPH cytochrome P450 oxidoreductase family protein [Asticcacaulis machinosus]